MIRRIVKMTFEPDKVEEFKTIYRTNWRHIRGFEGCDHVELLQDINDSRIFFTYSHWHSEQDLENYRNSELFKRVWSATKVLFSERPQAWSLSAQNMDQ